MKYKDLRNTLVINGSLIFFCTSAIMGVRWSEDGAGLPFKIYSVLILLIGVSSLRSSFKQNARLLPLFVFCIYFFIGIIQGYSDSSMFLQMTCFSLPAICIGLNMKNHMDLSGIMKWIDVLLPLFALSFPFMVVNIFLSSMDGEGQYDQHASYMIAYCFLIDIYLLRYERYYEKFAFMDKRWNYILKFFLIPYFIVMEFFCGGRGAFITIMVGIILNIGYLKSVNTRDLQKGCLIIVLIGLFAIVAVSNLSNDYSDLLTINFGRVTDIFEGGHINTSSSSGRDEIYVQAYNLITQNPVWGYGLFSYLSYIIFPHNIFLEIALQGGIPFLSIACFIFILSFSKYRLMKRKDKRQVFLAPFLIFAFTELMFSGSYMIVPLFGFSLSYIYNYRFDRNKTLLYK